MKSLRCRGGPYHRKALQLNDPNSGTLTFTLRGQTGRYVYALVPYNYPMTGANEVLNWKPQELTK